MPKIGEMIDSKFLKKDDVGRGVLLTIARVAQHDVAVQGAGPEYKWCLEFEEHDVKPLVLNVTNMRILESIIGSDDTEDWIGNKIVAYNDPNISYAGKITGGIRLRAPKQVAVKSNPAPAPTPAPAPEADETFDDIPY